MKQIWILAQNTIKALIRKKDFYVFFIMLLVLLVSLLSENFFGARNVSRYIKDIGFFCLWLFSFIIAVTFASKQLPEEIDSKTILPLLAKPVTRTHFILGRFLGTVLASSSAYTIFYFLYIVVTSIKGEGIAFSLVIQAYIMGICFLSLVSAISILLTLYLTLSAGITVSFVIYFAIIWFADKLRAIVISRTGIESVLLNIVYYVIPHYEFYDLRVRLAHSWEAFPLWVLSGVIVYTILYTSVVLYISCSKLKKKFL